MDNEQLKQLAAALRKVRQRRLTELIATGAIENGDVNRYKASIYEPQDPESKKPPTLKPADVIEKLRADWLASHIFMVWAHLNIETLESYAVALDDLATGQDQPTT